MNKAFLKRFLNHISIHCLAVGLYLGLSMAMRGSWTELSRHVHTGLQWVGLFVESLLA